MKVTELVGRIGISLTNEEKNFVKSLGDSVKLSNLDDRQIWVAQNLVRKGIYEISNDTDKIVKVKNVFKLRSAL